MSRPSLPIHDLASLDACRRRLAWRYALSMALGLCAVLVVGYLMHSALVKQSLKSELVQLAQREADVHKPDLEAWVAGHTGPEDVSIGFRPHRTAFYYVLGPDTRLVHGNETRPSLRDDVLALLKRDSLPRNRVTFEEVQADEEGALQLALLRHPVKDSEGNYIGSVYAATDVGGSLAHLHQLLVVLLFLALGFVILAGLGGWWMADRSLHPLQQALRQQRDFIASASHELRAPLTVMNTALAMVEQAGREQLDDFHHQTLVDARDEVRRLGRLAEAMLLLARFDAGGLSQHRERLALDAVVERQVRLRRSRAEAREQILNCHLTESLTVVGDADLLARLVGAGLDNALAYTPPGSVITVRLEADAGRACLEIADNGPGMTEEQCRRAFERFYRGDPSRQRHQGGAGLGLAIVEEVATQHGGDVRLTSTPGAGVRLSVCLSLAS